MAALANALLLVIERRRLHADDRFIDGAEALEHPERAFDHVVQDVALVHDADAVVGRSNDEPLAAGEAELCPAQNYVP
jgi:hypothetical protein